MNRMIRSKAGPRLAAALLLALASGAAAQAAPARRGFYLDQSIQAAYNPLGAQLVTKLFYRLPLSDRGGILWESTKLDLGLENSLSPAFDFLGLYLDLEPIAFFDLTLAARLAGYHDALGYGFRELGGYEDEYDADSLGELAGGSEAGLFLSAAPTLKLAFGPLALSNTLRINYFRAGDGEGYFYEAVGNCVLEKSGFELYNDAYAVALLGGGLMAGLNHSLLYVPGSGYRSSCLKAVAAVDAPLSGRLSLYAALAAGLYLEDRYLEGEARVAGQAGILLEL